MTFWEDAERGRTYLGGARRICALDGQGRLIWSYDDSAVRTSTDEMLYFWAGRNDAGRTDGVVHMTELETYSAYDLDFDFDNTSGDNTKSLLNIG